MKKQQDNGQLVKLNKPFYRRHSSSQSEDDIAQRF